MRDRLPTVAAYLERLPHGVDSHPECQAKSSVLRTAIESRSLDDVLDQLPAPVRELVRDPPPVSAWVSEVHALVALLAIRDRHFAPGSAGLDAYEEWTFERNKELLLRPLYRALFLVLNPERLLNGVERRWAQFRRGTSVRLARRGSGELELVVQFPEALYEQTAFRGLRGALRAALGAAGAKDARITLVEATTRSVRYGVSWR